MAGKHISNHPKHTVHVSGGRVACTVYSFFPHNATLSIPFCVDLLYPTLMPPFIHCLPLFRFKGYNTARQDRIVSSGLHNTSGVRLGECLPLPSSSTFSSDPSPYHPTHSVLSAKNPESTSLQNGDTDSRIGNALGQPDVSDVQVVKASMSDV